MMSSLATCYINYYLIQIILLASSVTLEYIFERYILLYLHTGSMEDMDLPHPSPLSQSKHGIKGSNKSQEYEATTLNEFIQD